MRRTVIALAVAAAAFVTAGCDNGPGTVTGKHTTVLAGQTHYFVTIHRAQSGKATDEDVPPGTFVACGIGARWPECSR